MTGTDIAICVCPDRDQSVARMIEAVVHDVVDR